MNLHDFPAVLSYPYGSETGRFDCAWGTCMVLYGETSDDEYTAYLRNVLPGHGAEPYDSNRIGENRFATFRLPQGALHTYYTAWSRTVRLIFDPLSFTSLLPLAAGAFERGTDPTLCIMALDYSHRDVTDGNGMSYVVILADGSFLLYDGGYAQDTDHLYEFLRTHNRRADGEIVIAAWVLTHSHLDHYGNFRAFTERYADRVRVEYFVANPTSPHYFVNANAYDPFLTDRLPELLRAYPGARLVKLQTGQRMAVRDAVIEAYFSFHDVYPEPIRWLNVASLVTKLHIAGQEILFLADAEIVPDVILPKMYGNALKSDIFQVAHHGYSGGSAELFDLIAPQTAMWTTSRAAFDIRISDEWPRPQNRYLTREAGITRFFVADEGCRLLRLPYAGEEPTLYEYPTSDPKGD